MKELKILLQDLITLEEVLLDDEGEGERLRYTQFTCMCNLNA